MLLSLGRSVLLCLACLGTAVAEEPKMKFELRLAETAPAKGLKEAVVEGTTRKVYLHKEAVVTGRDIAEARPTSDSAGKDAIGITFTKAGGEKIAKATGAHKGKPLAIVVNGKVISAPVIRAKISTKAVISGEFSKKEIKRIVKLIQGK